MDRKVMVLDQGIMPKLTEGLYVRLTTCRQKALVSRPWYKHEGLMPLNRNPQVKSGASIDRSVLTMSFT